MCLAVNGTELVEWEWHATCSRQFDFRYSERITRHTGNLRPSYNLPAVFAVIKTELSWFGYRFASQTRNLYFTAVRGNESATRWTVGVACSLLSRIRQALISQIREETFRQPAVTSVVRADNKRRCKCAWFSMLISFAVCISRAASSNWP